jgi:hypothetical protein
MREIFIPRKRIPALQMDIDKYRRLYSGKKDLYLSIYEYKGLGAKAIHPNNAIIDKIFLDFDYDEDMKFFEDTRTVAKFLYDIGAQFKIRFSGRGFHIFIYLTDTPLKNPKKAIRGWVKDIHEKTNTTSDPSVVGDIRRVSRMLGTMNMKTHLYCIALDYAHLMNFTYDAICDMAKEWEPVYHLNDKLSGLEEWIIEGALVDISGYDSEEEVIKSTPIDVSKIKIQDGYPPCIEKMLTNPNLGYYERGQLISFLRDDGYSFYEILTILKFVLSEDKYYHCTEEENQPGYIYYVREDMMFSSCQTLKDNGLCPSNDCEGHNLYI